MRATGLTGVAIIASATLLVDQLLKLLARTTVPECASGSAACTPTHTLGPLMLVYVRNSGSALGLARGLGLWMALAACGLLLIGWYGRRLWHGGPLATLAVGLQAGGASSNLGDRLLLGGVKDVLSLGGGLAWNLADLCLLCGAVLAVHLLWRRPADNLTTHVRCTNSGHLT